VVEFRASQIRWDKTIISANYDDDLIGCLDGTMIKRHTIDGVILLNQQPYQVMQDLLTANRAQVLESGGTIWIESSRPKTPIATIHDRSLQAQSATRTTSRKRTSSTNCKCVSFLPIRNIKSSMVPF
jgi:hypothetical protein